jgi:1,4-dihydroxy-2-naphthoyl-CoA synthase
MGSSGAHGAIIPCRRKTTGANMDLKFSKVTRKGPITIITLSRPEVYNALHIDAHFELNKLFDDFSADPEQWVAIVTGAGDKAFCAGNDLKWQAAILEVGARPFAAVVEETDVVVGRFQRLDLARDEPIEFVEIGDEVGGQCKIHRLSPGNVVYCV